MRRIALGSFIGSAVWHFGWEAVRAWLYEQGFHIMNPYLFGIPLSSILHYGVTAALVCLGLWLFWKTRPKPATEGGKTNPPALVDAESIRLAGVVGALTEATLSWSFKLPLPADDIWIKRYNELRDSAHPIWTDDRARRLRIEFMHYCGLVGKPLGDAHETMDDRTKLDRFGRQLTSLLKGEQSKEEVLAIKPMFEAVAHVAKVIGDADRKNCFPKTRQTLRQAAFNRTILIKGNKSAEPMGGGYSAVQIDIPHTYWEAAEIGALATDKDSDDHPPHTFPHQFSDGRFGELIFLYARLRVNWTEILKEWP